MYNSVGSKSPYDGMKQASSRRKRKGFIKQWLRNYLREEPEYGEPIATMDHRTEPFNKSFEGWNIRLHKANGGHIIEAWKNEDSGPTIHSNYRRPHELFMVRDDQEMGAAINDVLIQLMLRG
jgi:hypothetical protein